jgi:hypothetical protein
LFQGAQPAATASADGVAREVFEERDGRQYVLDDADRRAYGQWLPPADEPYITGTEGSGDDR